MRVAVVDIGTNSTRLLIADVGADAEIAELQRRSTVTRLGHGVDRSGLLDEAAKERVFATLASYRDVMDAHAVQAATAVLTSAVRDARDGAQFTETVAQRFDLDAHVISGDEEARLTFLGATSRRPRDDERLVVIDIGGGSTELVAGRRGSVDFHVSTQTGVVRQSERFLTGDPPSPAELRALAADVDATFADAVPPHVREGLDAGIAVAGTATSCAAILQALEPYDPARVHGYTLRADACEALLSRLSALPEARRREVAGLHPDRAPTIVAGIALLLCAMRAVGLDAVEVSERDLLHGAAVSRAAAAARPA